MKDRVARAPDVAEEVIAVRRDGKYLSLLLDADVVRQFQRGLRDHAEPAVAADGAVEDLRIRRGARRGLRTVREDQPDGLHRQDQGTKPHVAPVRVHGERAADREIGIRLHDPHGQVRRVDALLDLTPPRSRLHRDGLGRGIEGQDAVEPPHVDLQRSLGGDLAAHAVARAADGDRSGGAPDRRDDLFGGGRGQHPADGDRIELGDVVDDQRRCVRLDGVADHPPHRHTGRQRHRERQPCGEELERSRADAGQSPHLRPRSAIVANKGAAPSTSRSNEDVAVIFSHSSNHSRHDRRSR